MKPKSICIFGDSTAWGAWDFEKGGWVNRLWLDVGNRAGENYVEIYNCSISGGDSEGILKRFESEALAREADALIFQTGGNDSAHRGDPSVHIVHRDKFRSNLEEIIRRAKEITQNIIFVDLKKCDESKTTPVSWANVYYTNQNLHMYNEIMKDVCDKNNILFLDIFDALNDGDLADGIHPNTLGHEKIFRKVKRFLEENKWI
jgi:acyl-CoA thioesterase-1